MLSLVMVCTILLPTQLTVFAAGETETPSAAADEGVIVDDTVTDNTQKHYFTYSAEKDQSGHKGWAEDTKDKIVGGTEAKTQHWVWDQNPAEAGKHTYTFTFKGTGVEIYGVKNDDQNVFQLDQEPAETKDIAGDDHTAVVLYERKDLGFGEHVVKVSLPDGKGTGLQVCYAKVYGENAGPEVEPQPAEVIVDDTARDNTKPDYFTYYTGDKESAQDEQLNSKGTHDWVADANGKNEKAEAKTQHWVWSDTYADVEKCWYTFTFVGTGVELMVLKSDETQRVQLDDKEVQTVTVPGGHGELTTAYKVTGLENTKHTVKVRMGETGKGLQVSYAKVYKTATDPQPEPNPNPNPDPEPKPEPSAKPHGEALTIRHDKQDGSNNKFTYSDPKDWTISTEHSWSNVGTADKVWYQVDFVGNAIDVYSGKNSPMGMVQYYIDDEPVGKFSLYNSSNINETFIAQFAGLEEGPHTFKAVATGEKATGSSNTLIDAAKVVVYHDSYTVTKATCEKQTLDLKEGQTYELPLTLTPDYASLSDVTFSSDQEAVAKVNAEGVVEAVSVGDANITVCAKNGGAELLQISVTVAEATIAMGGSIVDVDTQYTQDRYAEVNKLNKTSEKLTAWRNDKAISEIALVSKDCKLTNVTITATDLTAADGSTIAASNIETTFIKSTQAWAGAYPGYGGGGKKKDPPPQGNRKESSDILYQSTPMDVPYNAVQPIWVSITVPKDAKAGDYTTTITVTADRLDTPLTFTYTLHVQDAVSKDATEFKKSFDIELWQYPYSVAEYYGVKPFSPEHLEILKPHMELYKEMGGHAVTATIVEDAWDGQTYSKEDIHYPSMIRWEKKNGVMTYDYTDFDAWIQFNKENLLDANGNSVVDKIVLYSIAPWHGSFTYWENGVLKTEKYNVHSKEYRDTWSHFLKDLMNHVTEKGWFDECYIGVDERGFCNEAFDVIESVKNKDNKYFKTAGAINNFNGHRNIAMRITDINVGDNCVVGANEASFDAFVKEREEKGLRTTLYTCTEHKPGNFSLSAPVESYWSVINAGEKTAGMLRWAYDAWVEDPLRDTTHNAFEPGDCFLVFPDEKTAEHPVTKSSVRLERMAQGVRDVNKLRQMVDKYPDMQADVDALYRKLSTQAQVIGGGKLLTKAEQTALAQEMNGFRQGIDTLTAKYLDPDAHKGYEYDRVIRKEIDNVKADSETNPAKGNDGPAKYAFDGNTNTLWHTSYGSNQTSCPHTITWSVGGAKEIGKIEYIARTSGNNGSWKKFTVEGRNGNGQWFELATVSRASSGNETIVFEPKTVTELRVRVDESFGSPANTFATAAEIRTFAATAVSTVNGKRQQLRDQYADTRELNVEDYTSDSVAVLEKAQEDAKKVIDKDNATDEEIAAAAKALEDAVQGLTVDSSKLAPGAPAGGISKDNPFPNAGDKDCITDNIRIPGIITLQNGWLAASADARWNHHGDHGNIDGMFSVSEDGGKTWRYTFPQFFNDSVNEFTQLAANLMDPVLVQAEDGTIYLLIDAFPAGSALHGQASYHPSTDSGFVNVNGQQRLAVYKSATNQSNDAYDYYVGDFDPSVTADGKELAPVIAKNDSSETAKYYVDRWFNLYTTDKQIMVCKQLGSDKYVQQNLFYFNADLHVRMATYLWLITSTDNGASWSAPQLLNDQTHYEGATFLGVGPGAGLSFVDAEGTNVIAMPTYANPKGERSNFVYTWDDGKTWKLAPDAPTGTSESCMVQLDETTVRKFVRSSANQVEYIDYTWNPETHEFAIGSLVQVPGTAKTSGNEVSAVRYPKTVNGKPVILVSTATGGNRGHGHIYALNVEANKTMTVLKDYQVSHDNYDYHYSSLTVKPDGDIALFYEDSFTGAGFGAGGHSHHKYLNITKEDLGLTGTLASDSYTFELPLYQEVDGSLAPIPAQNDLNQLDAAMVRAELRDGKVFYTGLKAGTQTLKYTKNGKDITITLNVAKDASIKDQNVELEIGEEQKFTVTDAVSYESDPSVVTAKTEPVVEKVISGQTGTDKSYNGTKQPLSDALYTFTKQSGDNVYTIQNKTADGQTVYLKLVGGSAGYPSDTTAQNITVGMENGSFTFKGNEQSWLWFWKEGDDHRFDRNSSHKAGNCDFDMFRPAKKGEATPDITGYVKLTKLEDIKDGGKYLIAAKADNDYYVLRPSSSTSNKYDHVLHVIGEEPVTVGYTLTLTGVKGGKAVVVAGDTAYHVTVNGPEPVMHTVTIDGKQFQIADGEKLGTNLPETAEKDGFVFKGWQDEQGNAVTADTVVNRDMTITAIFEPVKVDPTPTPDDTKPTPTPDTNQPTPTPDTNKPTPAPEATQTLTPAASAAPANGAATGDNTNLALWSLMGILALGGAVVVWKKKRVR